MILLIIILIYALRCRNCLAGAVLEIPSSFIHCRLILFRIFKTLTIPNLKSWGAEILRECSRRTMCHMSCTRCQVSGVRCHMPGVRWQVSGVIFFFDTKWWRVCCQRSLSGLVSIYLGQHHLNIASDNSIYVDRVTPLPRTAPPRRLLLARTLC